jgi:hypothetical protein
MNLTFEDAVSRLEAAPAGARLVVPVRITAHGEDGAVLYGYGGLGLEGSESRFVHVSGGDVLLTRADSYEFVGARLATEGALTNQRVRLLNNQAYDPNISDNWFPPTFQSFLVTRPDRASVQIGWAIKRPDLVNRRLILRVTRGDFPDFVGVDVEVEQQEVFLTGLGALTAVTAAIWTVSFLDPIPYAGNEIG